MSVTVDENSARARIAQLVAAGAAAAAVFEAVVEETKRVLDVPTAALARYEPDAAASLRPVEDLPVRGLAIKGLRQVTKALRHPAAASSPGARKREEIRLPSSPGAAIHHSPRKAVADGGGKMTF